MFIVFEVKVLCFFDVDMGKEMSINVTVKCKKSDKCVVSKYILPVPKTHICTHIL